jgi:putative peptide zinc metalloprotease protein
VSAWVLLALVAWIGVPLWLILDPSARPTASAAWLGDDVMLNFVVLSAMGWTLVVLHELSHVFAMRALGQDCTLTIGHRLYFVVLQSNVAGARALPRRMRYVPYLSGMTWDLLLVFICLLVHATVLPLPILGAVVYVLAMGLLFQFAFFMRTDTYYVLTNWLRLGNLMEDMRHWLANAGARLAGARPRHDLSAVPARELRLVRWYALFCGVSFIALTGTALVYYAPLLSKFLTRALDQLATGPGDAAFWDGAAFTAITVGYFGVLAWVTIRDLRRRRRLSVA